MADQNFRVKRGLEVGVGKTVLYADPGGNIGVGITQPSTKLEVAGDLSLYNGSTYSTVIQSITPTANRTISFPDQTGTVGLVAGVTGNVQYNNAGKLAGSSDFNVDLDWNEASTVFTGLKLNVTDTASLSDSNLLDLQVGGSSKFNVTKAGQLKTTSGQGDIETGISPDASDYRVNINGLYVINYGRTYLSNNASSTYKQWLFDPGTGFALNSDGYFGWNQDNFNAHSSSTDIKLWRDDAGILAQRDDTNAQTFRLYNTWGNNGVDFERTSITRDSSGFVIDAQKGGTGVDPTNLLDLKLDGTSKVTITGSGNVGVASTNPQYKIDVNGSVGIGGSIFDTNNSQGVSGYVLTSTAAEFCGKLSLLLVLVLFLE